MVVTLVHAFRFEAAHLLPRVPEGHKCRRLHGHSYAVEVAVRGPVNPDTGFLVDFDVLEEAWKPVFGALDHHYLNEVPGLDNPTSEHLCKWIWDKMIPLLPQLSKVTVFETTEARCEYEGE